MPESKPIPAIDFNHFFYDNGCFLQISLSMWDPKLYIHGQYIQNQINMTFLNQFKSELFGTILDVGCGDGQFSRQVSKHALHEHILGIDNSETMIKHANSQWAHERLVFEKHAIEDFERSMSFDFVLSFWCLHWTDISRSLPRIFHTLKNGGKLYALCSSLTENSMIQTWHELAAQNRASDIVDMLIHSSSQNRDYFFRIVNVLNNLPFKHVRLHLKTTLVALPHLDYFKNLLLTMPWIKTIPSARLNDLIQDMLSAFQSICQRKYGNKLHYETRPIFIEAIK